jgi:chaperonin cofactor prefoldin
MSESHQAELQYWQSVVDDMQVSSDGLREQLEILRKENESLHLQTQMQANELKQLQSMLQRIQIAMSQGTEL